MMTTEDEIRVFVEGHFNNSHNGWNEYDKAVEAVIATWIQDKKDAVKHAMEGFEQRQQALRTADTGHCCSRDDLHGN